jgi:hypothetical protein
MTQPLVAGGKVQITDGVDDVLVSATGRLMVDAGVSSTEYTEGDTDSTITGGAILWEDASDTLRAVSVLKPLPVGTKTDLTPSSPTLATVGVASAQAVAAAATRKGLILVNTSTVNISLGFGSTAVLNSGVTLLPGATFVMDEYSFDVGAVNAIAAAASSNLAVQEYTT